MADDPMDSGGSGEILDPRAVYEREGETGLQDQLEGLDRDVLERIVRTHPPHHTTPPALETLSDRELIGYIVDGARRDVD
jgi:hypothetical protein